MAHLIGFTDIDDKGQEALELAFESDLTGKPGSRRVIKDRRGHIIEDVESIRKPQDGAKLALSIDARIQYLAFRELKNAVVEQRAKAGGIVVLDAQTGEVLAMANLPSYNPNNRGKLDPRRTRNRAVTDLFEPGSTLEALHHIGGAGSRSRQTRNGHPDRARATSRSATARSTTRMRKAR